MRVLCSKMPLKRLQRTKSHIKTISAVEGFSTHLSPTDFACHYTHRESHAAQSDLHNTAFYSIVIREGDWAEPPGAVSPPAERKTLHPLTVCASRVCSETRLCFQPADKLVKDTGHNRQTHVTFLYFFLGLLVSLHLRGLKFLLGPNLQTSKWNTPAHHIQCQCEELVNILRVLLCSTFMEFFILIFLTFFHG